MYCSSPTHVHSEQHAYMERGVTLQNCMGFICPKSHQCYLRNKNDKFIIQETIMPIASKRQVTHYPRVTKKKNKHGQQPQPPTKQTRGFYEIKGFISVVSIWGSCLKLLQVALASNFVGWLLPLGSFCLYLSLF